MNLRPIYPPRPGCLPRACLDCHGHVPLDGGFADLDGPAFAAYYCLGCAKLRFPRTSTAASMLESVQMQDHRERR